MNKQYTKSQWRHFSTRIAEKDGWKCTREGCVNCRETGAVLQVHHTIYLPGRKPWEYDDNVCLTLCSGCHAQVHSKVPPQGGWELVCIEDLGEVDDTCQVCSQEIRYLHHLVHPDWTPLVVGCDCCERMVDTPDIRSQIDALRSGAERARRFINSVRWSIQHGDHVIDQDGYRVRISPRGGRFAIFINGVPGQRKLMPYRLEDAKAAIHETLSSYEKRRKIDDISQRMIGGASIKRAMVS